MNLGAEMLMQIQVCNFVQQCTKLPFIHIANEGKRSHVNGSLLRRMGLRAGVSDIFMPRGNARFSGLWIELKAGKNKPTPSQLEFINEMITEGYHACVCYSAEEAILTIKTFYSISETPS